MGIGSVQLIEISHGYKSDRSWATAGEAQFSNKAVATIVVVKEVEFVVRWSLTFIDILVRIASQVGTAALVWTCIS